MSSGAVRFHAGTGFRRDALISGRRLGAGSLSGLGIPHRRRSHYVLVESTNQQPCDRLQPITAGAPSRSTWLPNSLTSACRNSLRWRLDPRFPASI